MQKLTTRAVFAGLIAVAACDTTRPISGEAPPGGTYEVPTGDPTGGAGGGSGRVAVATCTACHGTPGLDNTGADPLVAAAPPRALLGDAGPAVGAHRAHLVNGPLSNAVECASCHLVPTTPPPHAAQRQGKVSFSRLATRAWNGAPVSPTWNGGTCASTYCHGNFRNGNAANTPSWTAGAAGGACGSCHGVPPGGTHAQDPVGGTPLDCGGCHEGYTRTTVNLALHVNGRLDAVGGHPPGWKEPDQHGLGALAGGLDACTTCHTGYESAGASAASSCNACHATPAAYGPYATGTYPDHASWQTECTFCHGGTDDATGAPPRNTDVISSDTTTPQPTTDATIGAHASHVGAAHGIAAPLDCTACHETRWASATDPGHVDAAPAEVFFNDVGPSANPGSYGRPDCSSTYCHGNFTGGAGTGPIAWTGTFGGAFTLGCTSCHGQPPGPTSATVHHPPNPACGSCHAYAAATHVNGVVDHTPATGCTQCHGDLTASAVASTDVRAAPASNANAVSAHGDAATATSARGIGAHAAHLGGTTWRATPIACTECHAVPGTGNTAHANGNPAVVFGSLAATAWPGQPPITPAWNGAGGAATLTCASTYCHGNFKNGASATPTWAAPSAVACGSCHGVSATSGPGGTHPTFGTGQNCGSCHGGTYTNGSVDLAMHLDGNLDLSGGSLSCSSCHGDATRTPVASATTLDALGANLVRASPPLDAGGGAAATGAHLAHVNQGDAAAPGPLSNALACTSCHVVPTATSHSNGAVGVTFAGLAVTGGATPAPYDLGTHTCASTYCHGNFTGGAGANAITWTSAGKLGCSSCHGAPPATSATVHHPPNPACASCHTGYSATTVTAATHVNGTIQAPPAGCTQCHGDLTATGVANTDVRAAPASNANAVSAHGDAATATSARGVGAHAAHLGGTTWRATPIGCGECHAVPATGDVTHADANPAVAFGALARTAWTGPALTPVWNGAGGATNLTCASTYCHGNFPNGANAAPTWATPSAVGCGSCHLVSLTNGPGGTHPTLSPGQDCGSCHGGTYTSTSVDPALHLNGVLDGGGESGGGSSCAGCHGAIFQAMNGGVVKAKKHTLGAVAGTNDSATDSGAAWASPLSGVAAADRSCVNMCHGDHPHDLTSPATATHENHAYADATDGGTRANGTGSRVGGVNRMKTDFDATLTNGGLCVSCHRNPVAANGLTVSATAFGASAHDFTSNTVGPATHAWSYTTHDGGVFDRNCTKCHASRAEGTTPSVSAGQATAAVHFGDDASLLAGTTNPAGTPAGFVCYNCHGSAASPANGAQGNRSGRDIQSQIAKASGHPAHADAVHDGAAEFANAAFGNELGVAAGAGQRHASCLDCHAPHEAKAGTHATPGNLAGPPLEGAWGAQLSSSPAFWTDPVVGSFTKRTLVAGVDLEATLCFKCHSSYYGTLPTSPSGGYTETDTAKEFNPNNAGNWATAGTANAWSTGETAGGFHPVLADAGSNLGRINMLNLLTTNFPWRTSGARNLMTCTDCHESNGTADPNGPHGSTAGFILRGPNTAWNNTLVATSTNTMPTGTFCANCHSSTWASSRFSGGETHTSRSQHKVACMNCHAAIPHGGPRPGMLVAPAGFVVSAVGSYAGWDEAPSPYMRPGTGSRLYLKSYPTTGTGNWANSNCGCNAATGNGH